MKISALLYVVLHSVLFACLMDFADTGLEWLTCLFESSDDQVTIHKKQL